MFFEYVFSIYFVTKKSNELCSSISPNNFGKCYDINQFNNFIVMDLTQK